MDATLRDEPASRWTRPPASDAAQEAVRVLARALLPDVSPIGRHLTDHVLRGIPELARPQDPTWPETVYLAARSNVSAILAMLAEGVAGRAAETPLEARAFYERQAEHEDGLVTVLRTYRLGIAELWQVWAAHVTAGVDDPALTAAVLTASTADFDAYQDRMAEESAAHWRETRSRKRAGLDRSPADIVRGALAGGRTDELVQLGYDVDAEHLAIALAPGSEDAVAAPLAVRIRGRLGLPTVLLTHEAAHVVWVALTDPAIGADQVAATVGPGTTAGLSNPNPGAVGFRTSHREAVDALRIGLLRGTPVVTPHDDIALVAALSADPERARALVRREIGPLLDDTAAAARLRATLRAFLACGDSHVRAAHLLGVHEKTVTYRVRQAEERLGRRVGDRRAELESALLVHEVVAGRRSSAAADDAPWGG
ncbi:PucR family transcriptional regulator [Patulibacter minatonensis]|uniref:PucR family transcriptional regulator n=1 Tax=Patulibacter minatonensis TaxID=298163 RepID=UPI00047D910C|nr:PucR family transcriptional regulator [Patulibacter minatonensis]